MSIKTAIITGASSGIGKAIYDGFKSEKDWKVFGLSRRGPDFFINVAEYQKEAPLLPEVHLLVNAAGIMPFEENQEVMQVNFWGTYHVIQNFLPAIINGGCIINIASVSGMVHDPDLPVYSASKAAVISLTKSLAKKLAKQNIRVNCISPGFYSTNLVPENTPIELIQTIPLGYEESPKKLVCIVKSIWETKYMTGANIVVDGGVSL